MWHFFYLSDNRAYPRLYFDDNHRIPMSNKSAEGKSPATKENHI